MKRFSAREMALVASPLIVVGVAGFFLPRRKASTPNERRLSFELQRPTTLEAFQGVDKVFVVDSNWIQHTDFWLKVRTARERKIPVCPIRRVGRADG